MGMKKENIVGMMGMMMAMSGNSMHNHSTHNEKAIIKPKKNIIPKGLKEFFYGEEVIYALNKKNADRKAKKLGLTITDVVVPKGTFCGLFKKDCIGNLCSVTSQTNKCAHLK